MNQYTMYVCILLVEILGIFIWMNPPAKRIREQLYLVGKFLLQLAAIMVPPLLLVKLFEVLLKSDDFLGHVVDSLMPETIGMVFTVFIIERFNRNRATQERKRSLFRQLKSRSNDLALDALEQILAEDGWWNEARKSYQKPSILLDQPLVVFDDVQWEKADLAKANLRQVHLGKANLQQVKLHYVDLYQAQLQDANLQQANLFGAILLQANLMDANLQQAHLWNADLRSTKLIEANLRHAILGGADLRQADLRQANLRDAKNIDGVIFNSETLLPDAKVVDRDVDGSVIYNIYWTPDTDMTRYINPNHPDFWEPEYLKPGYEGDKPWWVDVE